jgi:hypothetical protein
MASDAYQDGAVIVLWWDESEGGDTAQFTLPFIVVSKNAHANVNGLPYVDPKSGYNWLGAAATANDLSALLKDGAIK